MNAGSSGIRAWSPGMAYWCRVVLIKTPLMPLVTSERRPLVRCGVAKMPPIFVLRSCVEEDKLIFAPTAPKDAKYGPEMVNVPNFLSFLNLFHFE